MKFAFAEKSREGDPDFNREYEKAVSSEYPAVVLPAMNATF